MNIESITETSLQSISSLHNNLTDDGILFEVADPNKGRPVEFLLVNDIGKYFEKHEVDLDSPEGPIIITTFEFKGKIYYIDWANFIYDTTTFCAIGVWDDLERDISYM